MARLLYLPHLNPLNPTLGGSGSCEGPEPGGGVCAEIQHPQGLWLLRGTGQGPKRG